MAERYFLQYNDQPECEVTKQEFVSAERAAGFRNTLGQPAEPATAAFSAGSIHGRIQYGCSQGAGALSKSAVPADAERLSVPADTTRPVVVPSGTTVLELAALAGAGDLDPFEREVKQVIVIRRDLGMRRGKEIAQGAHAAMAWLTRRLEHVTSLPAGNAALMTARLTEPELMWVTGSFTKVVCQVPDDAGLASIVAAAHCAGVIAHEIIDAGRTEFSGVPTRTAVAVGPDWADVINAVTGELRLY